MTIRYFHPAPALQFALCCTQWASCQPLLLSRHAATMRRKLVIGLTFVCTFSIGQRSGRSGSSPPDAFLCNHRSHMGWGKAIEAFDLTEEWIQVWMWPGTINTLCFLRCLMATAKPPTSTWKNVCVLPGTKSAKATSSLSLVVEMNSVIVGCRAARRVCGSLLHCERSVYVAHRQRELISRRSRRD